MDWESLFIRLKRGCDWGTGKRKWAAQYYPEGQERFALVKIPPGRGWCGRGSGTEYIPIRYALLDLQQLPPESEPWGGYELFQKLLVKKHDGRLKKEEILQKFS